MNQERVFNVLLGPHVSEKSAAATEMANQYAFRVARDATKPEIRAAVEQRIKVEGPSVPTGRRRMCASSPGRTSTSRSRIKREQGRWQS